jgi:hypothetical protein
MPTIENIEIFVVTRDGGLVSFLMINDDYLDALREFIDFINRQVGVYMDAMAGFAGNKVRMELQTARVRRRLPPQKQNDGSSVVVSSSLEDPSRPNVILNRISRAQDYVADNSEGGFNEQQHTRAIIVFIFAYWDEEIRPRLARAKRLSSPNEIRVDALGDLRLLRGAIIHNKGILPTTSHEKMKVMQDMFTANAEITVPRDTMHRLFVGIKQGIGQLIIDHIGARPGAPDVGQIKDVSIQRIGPAGAS